MIDNYLKLRNGHWYQMFKTAPGPKYDVGYAVRWNTFDNDPLSNIRLNCIKKTIGEFSSILDFGYGNGNFLENCYKYGITCYGYDISNYKLPNYINIVHDPDTTPVDVITFYDSLEHLPDSDLVTILERKPVKYCVVSVPHMHENLGAEWFKKWKHRKPNEHRHHFDVCGLTGLLNESGFNILYVGHDEDVIRTPVDHNTNILTVIGQRRDL